ncbi:MAG: hypothetical protein ABIE70_08560 [bacterium]
MTYPIAWTLGLLLFFASPVVSAGDLIQLGDDVLLPITENWMVKQSSEYPYLLTTPDHDAEIKIFRSVIEAEYAIHNSQEFRTSVDSVIQNAILDLPQARLISNTGYGGGYQVSFALEFETADDIGFTTLRHRLIGILMRHPDGYQLLYTLWGRASLDAMVMFGNEMEMIQDGFMYRGPTENNPFAGADNSYGLLWLSLPLILVLVIVLQWRRRRRPVDSSRWVRQWLCRCGQANDLDRQVCSRCSRPRRIDPVS